MDLKLVKNVITYLSAAFSYNYICFLETRKKIFRMLFNRYLLLIRLCNNHIKYVLGVNRKKDKYEEKIRACSSCGKLCLNKKKNNDKNAC